MLLILTNIFLLLFALFTALPLLLSWLAKIVKVQIPFKELVKNQAETDFACVITAYKDIECAKNLVLSLLQQNYVNFHVYLLADDCEISSWTIQHPKFSLLVPNEVLHSKVKSIRYTLENLVREHPYFVVFDPDNLAHPDFLKQVNFWHKKGFEVVQGKRIAKNLDTKYARLDAVSEYYYNYAHRTVTFTLGSSATIAGSGMAMPVQFYTQFLQEKFDTRSTSLVIAEDKMLQMYVVEKGYRIAFAEKALVFDEKVSTAHQVKRQRTRWITSYFQYLMAGLSLFFRSLGRCNWNKVLFAYTIISPPMFLVGLTWLVASFVLVFVSSLSFLLLQLCFLAFLLNVFSALLLGGAPSKVTLSLFFAPFFVFNQVKALLSMNQTRTSFLTTEKTKNMSLDEVLHPKS